MNTRVGVLSVTLMVSLLMGPIVAEAQQAGRLFRIGVLTVPEVAPPDSPRWNVWHKRLRELGYIKGRHYSFEHRMAGGNYDRLPALAADLVRARVDLILALGNKAAQVVLDATDSIPIVSVSCDAFTVVTSLARHGRNLTGITCMRTELTGKRLEILKETLPKAKRVAVLYNPIEGPAAMELAETVARRLNIALVPVPVRSAKDLETALDSVRQQRVDALLVNPDAILFGRRQQIVDFTLKHRLPAVEAFGRFVDAGGLMSYGSGVPELIRRATALIDKIIKGAKPSDLPFEQATRFSLRINMKTAKALGVTIPPSVLVRADKVIK